MRNVLKEKPVRLFIILGGFFIANTLVAEFIGVKIFALEETLGIDPWNWNLFGHSGSFMLTAGVLLWPVVFIMTDIINDYYGRRGVKLLSYLAAGLIIYAFMMVYGAIHLSPAGFWTGSFADKGVPDAQAAFTQLFGQGLWIIAGSLLAFLIGQILDAFVFYKIKKATGDKKIWLRATISTLLSQFFDSFIVLYVAFVLGPQQWDLSLFFAVGCVNYSYKFVVAFLLIPTLYLAHYLIERYLGKEKAIELRQDALER